MAASLFGISSARAEVVSLTCENWRREYMVRYDSAANTVLAGDTNYKVLAVEKSAGHLVIVGLTVNDGPTFKLHLSPYKKIEFYSNSALDQTDGCH